jgi:hypothetical protein
MHKVILCPKCGDTILCLENGGYSGAYLIREGSEMVLKCSECWTVLRRIPLEADRIV